MLIDYLPPFMQQVEEIKKIMNISPPEIEKINENIQNILKDFFVMDASEQGVKTYEKILKITPKLTDTLDKRKYDILSIYNQTLPFTLETLKQRLNALCGENGYIVNICYSDFVLNLTLKLNNIKLLSTVSNMLENIVPVNMVINIYIDYNKWKDFCKLKWSQAKLYKWGDIKESEEIKNTKIYNT